MSALEGPSQTPARRPDDGGEPSADDRPSALALMTPGRSPAPLQTVAFWLAVGLPFLYVPLLVSGVATDGEWTALGALFVLNLAALYVGHDHRPGR